MALSRRAFFTGAAATLATASTSAIAQTSYPSIENGVVEAERYMRNFFNSTLGKTAMIDRRNRYANLYQKAPHTISERQEFKDLAFMFETINNFRDGKYNSQSLNIRLKTTQCLMGNMINAVDVILIPNRVNSNTQKRDHMLAYYDSLNQISPLDGQHNCRRLYQQLAR